MRDAVEAMKLGALEYLLKPYNLEALKILIQHALDQRRARLELGVHRRSQQERYTFEAMVTRNPAYAALVALARKFAQSPTAPLLIEGETGVGKEFLARAIHHASPRGAGPFVPISCAAIPDTLLESELFGHEAGAFTDARTRKKGLFELAEGGTIFLDEVGEMAVPMQAKLLRAIETLVFRRVGGTEDLTVDARFVAATNVEVEGAVERKEFREDLYYRLKVGRLHVPPLRERREDLLALADQLLLQICREVGRRPAGLSEAASAAFMAYRWPGNVRELKNVLERAVILKEGDGPVELAHLPQELVGGPGGRPTAPAAAGSLSEVERVHILRVLESSGGNHTRAAKALGISRTTLWEKLKQYRPPSDE
ncbi:MAG: sigma-54 dependent transcriptional regulator, partial [bacterium]